MRMLAAWLTTTSVTRRSGPLLLRRHASMAAANTAASSSSSSEWEQTGLRRDVCALAEGLWPKPNAVQLAAIGTILEGSDTVLGAETGSGKTLAYLLPAIEKIEKAKDGREYPSVMVLVPNRELGTQLQRVARQLGADTIPPFNSEDAPFSLSARSGGQQLWPFRRNECPDVVVATPSFAVNFDKNLDLWASLRLIVFDEADELLDGGYKQQMERILVSLKRVERTMDGPRCQRCIVAATLPTRGLKSVENLIQKHFKLAKRVVDPESGQPLPIHAPVGTLQQNFVRLDDFSLKDRVDKLVEDNIVVDGERTLIFSNTANAAQKVTEYMIGHGKSAAAYHARIRPEERLDTLDAFASGSIDFLCCTDLAARGLDLPDVKHVVQLEFALNVVSHLHRVGRAARAGASGRATNFYDKTSAELIEAIDSGPGGGSVVNAFSRRRAFRQKIKQRVRRERGDFDKPKRDFYANYKDEEEDYYEEDDDDEPREGESGLLPRRRGD